MFVPDSTTSHNPDQKAPAAPQMALMTSVTTMPATIAAVRGRSKRGGYERCRTEGRRISA
jgi:hypothetical protein